jgi:5'-nucleotidase
VTATLILITNDDGIGSPGLAATAAAMEGLGELLVVAPAEQQTSMGRCRTLLPHQNGDVIRSIVRYQDKEWPGYSVNASPALVVEIALQQIASRPVGFVVSGINYGENIGTCINVSGTLGAAMEAAERGIHSLAVSLETPVAHYYEYHSSIDFTAAMYFTRFFAEKLIRSKWPDDVDVFKIEIPAVATDQSSWMLTVQDRISYYTPQLSSRGASVNSKIQISSVVAKGQYIKTGSDAHALALGKVSITPLSLDQSSRTSFPELQKMLHSICP